jgi:hypothetical protein
MERSGDVSVASARANEKSKIGHLRSSGDTDGKLGESNPITAGHSSDINSGDK